VPLFCTLRCHQGSLAQLSHSACPPHHTSLLCVQAKHIVLVAQVEVYSLSRIEGFPLSANSSLVVSYNVERLYRYENLLWAVGIGRCHHNDYRTPPLGQNKKQSTTGRRRLPACCQPLHHVWHGRRWRRAYFEPPLSLIYTV